MSEIEQGIELTLKVLMKVKDEEMAALCNEIKHRDTELENLKKENERLKSENEMVKRIRDFLQVEMQIQRRYAKAELTEMKTIHQLEMMEKCQRDLDHLRTKIQFQNVFDAWVFYCKKTFTYENLQVEKHEDTDKQQHELKLKVQKMSEHQEAFLTLVKEKGFGNGHIESFKNELEYLNIWILKNILRRFGCTLTWGTVQNYLTFFDENDESRTYGDVGMDNSYDERVVSLYDYEFKI